MLLNNPRNEQYLLKICEDVQTPTQGIRQRYFRPTLGPSACPFCALNDICSASEKSDKIPPYR